MEHVMTAERKDNNYLFDSGNLSEGALAKKHRIENDPSARTNIMDYLPGMEVIQSDIAEKVLSQSENYDYSKYTGKDVTRALEQREEIEYLRRTDMSRLLEIQ